MSSTKSNLLFWTALITAVWFALSGMAWTYSAALIIAYPFGLTSFFLWRKIKSDQKSRNKYIPMTLALGLTLSLVTLIGFLIFD